MNLEQEFIPYQEALELKKLDFDEECIYHYKKDNEGKHTSTPTFEMLTPFGKNHNLLESRVSAPLYQQAFRWFREKYGLFYYITTHDSTDFEWYIYDKEQNDWEDDTMQDTYEEAELACLRKLIEIVKSIHRETN